MATCSLRKLALAAALAAIAAGASYAAVSVTELTVTGGGAPYEVAYVLNTGAASGSIDILNGSGTVVRTIALSGNALSKGLHFVNWDGKDAANTAVPAGSYTARVTVAADPVAAPGATLWGPIDVASNTAPVRFGITVNKNVGSPYYGRIYVSDYSNDTVRGYSADGVNVLNLQYPPAFPAGVRGLSVGADDRLYANVQTDSGVPNIAGLLSFKQDGTDPIREADFLDQPRQMVVTGTGANRRFYYAQGATQTVGPAQVLVQVPGDATQWPLLNNLNDPALDGTIDGLAVLDPYNDPVGHANNVSIYVRTNATSATVGQSTILKFDNGNGDPLNGSWVRDPNFNVTLPQPATPGYTAGGLAFGPDGHLWTAVSLAAAADRGFYKIDKTTGAIITKVNPVPQKPRYAYTDNVGNVVGVLLPDATNSNWGKSLAMFALPDSGSTDTRSSAAFSVTGTSLTPVNIINGPTATASSTTASVAWTTDVDSSTQVFYGTSPTALSGRVTVAGLTKNHAAFLTGLTVGTTYYYQVRSAASGMAAAMSEVATFLAKDAAPTITNLAATTTQTTATVTWTTDKATDSTVLYGLTPDALPFSATGNAGATAHTVTITGLTPGTTYYFVAQSGSATIATGTSTPSFFATLTSNGSRVRTLTSFGDFQYGLLDDILLGADGITLKRVAPPAGLDDAGVPDLPDRRANHASVAYGGYLYVLGGRGAVNYPTVFYAKINTDGTLGPWGRTTDLPDDRYFLPHAAFGYNGRIYVAGGGTPTTQQTTLVATQNPTDGTLGPWSVAGQFSASATPDGAERDFGAAAVYNGKVYYVGGESNDGVIHDNTYVADIKVDGTLSDWTTAAELLPSPTMQHQLAAHDGTLYAWGGTSDGVAGLPVKWQSAIGPDGAPGAWTDSGAPPSEGRFGFAGGLTNGFALMVGGTSGVRSDKVSYAPLYIDGTLGDFQDATFLYHEGAPLRDMDGAVWQNRLYVTGGRATDAAPTYDPGAVPFAAAVVLAPTADSVKRGHYESRIIDLGQVENLQKLEVVSSGGLVMLKTRLAGADGVLGPWTQQPSLAVTFPNGTTARYVQFALDLAQVNGSTPVVDSVALTYGIPQAGPTVEDVRKALSIASGLVQSSAADVAALDKNADGKITLDDAARLNRIVNGL
jgi:hypothetical protein